MTATPKRGDGLEKINYMLIGTIRYSYTAKEKAMKQGIQHLVYPRFTRTVPEVYKRQEIIKKGRLRRLFWILVGLH